MYILGSTSTMTLTSSRSPCRRHYLRQTLRICIFIIVMLLLVDATPHFLEEDNLDEEVLGVSDKRLARLSYFRAPYNSRYSRPRYDYNGRYGYGTHSYGGDYGNYDWWRKKAVNRYNMPWEALPNTNCLRKFCRDDRECCRRYSKCNEQARVCYDCWYGHPCSSNKDCCERYPYCHPMLRTCGN